MAVAAGERVGGQRPRRAVELEAEDAGAVRRSELAVGCRDLEGRGLVARVRLQPDVLEP
jgi:hypothetical protein